MKPGAVIAAHLHKSVAEALYVVEGDFTNEGSSTKRALRCIQGGKETARTPLRMGATARLWTERTMKERQISLTS